MAIVRLADWILSINLTNKLLFYNPNVCTMYSLYRNELLQTLGIKITNLMDIIQLILITLFSIKYRKLTILFGAVSLLCSIIIVDRDWLLLRNKRILQVFNTVNIIDKVYYKVCRINCYIWKTFMKILIRFRTVLHCLISVEKRLLWQTTILNSDWGWLLITE